MVRRFDFRTDYDEVCRWWSFSKWKPVPPQALPKLGFVSFSKQMDAVGFIYETKDTDIAFFAWPTVSPDCRRERRTNALNEIFMAVQQYALENGLTLFASIKNANLVSRMESAGFVKGDSGSTHLLWRSN